MRPKPAATRWRDPSLFVLLLPAILLQAFCLLAPFALAIALTFQTSSDFVLHWTWNLDTWREALAKTHHWSVLGRTLAMALACTIVCVAVSTPVAYVLATCAERLATRLKVLIAFAALTDATLKTYGWVLFLDKGGPLDSLLQQLGLPPGAVDLLFTGSATLIGMVYSVLPICIFAIYLAFDAVDRTLLLAARDAGAGRLRTFYEIMLPLGKPGLCIGAALAFILSTGAFLEPRILGGGRSPMMAELIRQTFETRINWPLGAALTVVLIVGAAFAFLVLSRVCIGQRQVRPAA
jgi:spermidine/putrescine transport system permease protein